jgi:hypothetical protein
MITYEFKLENGDNYVFEVDMDRGFSRETSDADQPFWTALNYRQCPNCTLKKEKHSCCPPAADLKEVVERFSSILSVTNVTVHVKTPNRDYIKTCDAQTGLDSLLGLIMSTSACPILGKLRTMAKTHLPFSTHFESIFRSVGNYLLLQYFIQQDGKKPDWDLNGLIKFYEELGTVNQHFADRVRDASKKDAGVNAVIQLSALSITVGASIEEQLDEFKKEFLQ